MPFNFDPKDNDPRNTLGKKLKKVIVKQYVLEILLLEIYLIVGRVNH